MLSNCIVLVLLCRADEPRTYNHLQHFNKLRNEFSFKKLMNEKVCTDAKLICVSKFNFIPLFLHFAVYIGYLLDSLTGNLSFL